MQSDNPPSGDELTASGCFLTTFAAHLTFSNLAPKVGKLRGHLVIKTGISV